MQASIVFRYKRMRGSCIEKNRCWVAINKERTENDVGILLSFFGGDTVDMASEAVTGLAWNTFPVGLPRPTVLADWLGLVWGHSRI